MLKRTEMRALAFVLGAATVVACSEGATAPDAQASASDVLFVRPDSPGGGGGGGGKPGGGGGGGAATTMEAITLGITAVKVFEDGASSLSPLVDGADRVSITLNNRLDVSTWAGNSKQEERQGFVHKLCTDMKNLVFVDDPLHPDDEGEYKEAGGVVGGILCSKSRMHTRNEDIEFDRLVATVDGATPQIAHAGGKIVPRQLDSNGAWDWRIIFDTPGPIPNDGSVPTPFENGKGLCVERTSPTTWRFFNHVVVGGIVEGCIASDGTKVDIDVELWRYNDGNPRMVAEFNMPFSFTVTSG